MRENSRSRISNQISTVCFVLRTTNNQRFSNVW